MDGEGQGASSAQPPGEPARALRNDVGDSGWTTTKQAAKVLGVSRRSVQGYVGRGLLEARDEGEGVNRRFLISIDSLNSLVDRRRREAEKTANFAGASPAEGEAAPAFANAGEGLRHLVERLEARTVEVTELRIRLELTERAQSTLEEELAEATRRREEAERELGELRRRGDSETSAEHSLEELVEERRLREWAEAERDDLRRNLVERPSLRGIVLISIVAAVAAAVLVFVYLGLPL